MQKRFHKDLSYRSQRFPHPFQIVNKKGEILLIQNGAPKGKPNK
jgi:hypothetical protein